MSVGMIPFDAPGTYSLPQYTELAEDIWYPIGGFRKYRRRSYKNRTAVRCRVPPLNPHQLRIIFRERSHRKRRGALS